MENIDAIRINFNPDQLLFLNICLIFLMFGIALDMKISDFKYLFKHPKAVLVGLTSQLILLPLLTFALAIGFHPATSIALGMILIGICPGGNVSNFAVHLAKANTALSVSLTTIVTFGAIILTPISFGFWSSYIPGIEKLSQDIHVPTLDMIKTIINLIIFCLLYTSPSPRDQRGSRMPSSA